MDWDTWHLTRRYHLRLLLADGEILEFGYGKRGVLGFAHTFLSDTTEWFVLGRLFRFNNTFFAQHNRLNPNSNWFWGPIRTRIQASATAS